MRNSYGTKRRGLARADEEALRSGLKSPEQLKRENEVFALPPDRIRINLDSAHSLS
jgi:hypothetical protein